MTSIELEVRNPSGLHARPAAAFVRTAGASRARIRVWNLTRGTGDVDGKSLLSVMGLSVACGHRIRVSADGDDEQPALDALRVAVEGGLGEVLDDGGPAADAAQTRAGDVPPAAT